MLYIPDFLKKRIKKVKNIQSNEYIGDSSNLSFYVIKIRQTAYKLMQLVSNDFFEDQIYRFYIDAWRNYFVYSLLQARVGF